MKKYGIYIRLWLYYSQTDILFDLEEEKER